MRNDLQAAVEDAICYHELQAKSIQETLSKANYPRTIELLYEDAKGYNETAIAALRDALQRQPDPATGLVPCGCGGKAELCKAVKPNDGTSFVQCTECSLSTAVFMSEERSRDEWNRAMGWREGNEN